VDTEAIGRKVKQDFAAKVRAKKKSAIFLRSIKSGISFRPILKNDSMGL
jgi:hypothetical protein